MTLTVVVVVIGCDTCTFMEMAFYISVDITGTCCALTVTVLSAHLRGYDSWNIPILPINILITYLTTP